jgi:hypothetical protein
MMNPVDTQLHQHKEIPGFGTDQMLGDPKMFFCLGIDTLEERLLIGGAKVLDVEDIATGNPFDFWLQL